MGNGTCGGAVVERVFNPDPERRCKVDSTCPWLDRHDHYPCGCIRWHDTGGLDWCASRCDRADHRDEVMGAAKRAAKESEDA